MTYAELKRLVVAAGGICEIHNHDNGYNLMVNIRAANGMAHIIRYSDEWGDTGPSAFDRAYQRLVILGILGDDDLSDGQEDPEC